MAFTGVSRIDFSLLFLFMRAKETEGKETADEQSERAHGRAMVDVTMTLVSRFLI